MASREANSVISLSSVPESMSAKPTEDELEVELGVPMALPFAVPAVLGGAGWNRTGDEQILFRNREVTIQQLNEMRRKDGQARALYRLMTLPIRAALTNATYTPAETDNGEAQFIEDMMTLPSVAGGMTINFHRVLAQMLIALFDGFSFFEQVYWVPEFGPLKGKITLKKLAFRPAETMYFIIDLHGNFRGGQQKCFSADTEVPLLDGTTCRIDELAKRTDSFWVYSTDDVGRVVPGRATARKTSDSEPLLEVTLDNGRSVRCTYTHPWRLRDGSYKRANDLLPGDSLMPLYRKRVQIAAGQNDYEQVWHPEGWSSSKTGAWQWTHAMVDQYFNGHMVRGHVVHHADVDRFNNAPSNLQRLTKAEHAEVHRRMGQVGIQYAHAWWATDEGRARRVEIAAEWGASHSTPEFSQETSERMKERWAVGVYANTARLREAVKRGREVSVEEFKQLAAAGMTRDEALGKLGVGRAYMERVLGEVGLRWSDLKNQFNHKVVAVRPVVAEAVYDIEVEKYHNFAIDAGVFVHNTVFQGRPIDVYIEQQNSFYFAANEEESPYYGVSYFESAFYHYDKKVKLYYLAHLSAQNRAVGVRLGMIPPEANIREKEKFRAALSNFGIAQAMLVPPGFAVEELGNKNTNFDFIPLIDHHDAMMSRSVLAMFLDEDKTTRLVDFSTQKDDMFLLMEHSIMDEVEALLNNYLFPKFIDWNFGSGNYPKFQFGAFTEEQKSAIRVLFNALAIAQTVNVSPEFLLQLEELMADELGLEIDYTDIEERTVKMIEQHEQVQEEQGKAQVAGFKQQQKAPVGGAGGGGGATAPSTSSPGATAPSITTPGATAPRAGMGGGTAGMTRRTAKSDTAVITLSDVARQVIADLGEETV